MSTLTKVFVVLTSVLAIALSCLFISAAAQWDNWRDLAQKNALQRDAEATHRQNAVASAQASLAAKDEALAERTRGLTDANRQIQQLSEDLARVRGELAVAKNEAMSFEAGRTKLQEILDVTTGELKSLQKQNQTLLTQNIDLQARNARLNTRMLELTTNVSILTDEARNMQEKLYACEQGRRGMASADPATPPEVAGATPVVPRTAGVIRGQVIGVDGVYASIDVGESSGVSQGMTFMVYRDGVYLGDLVVESVRPNEAGGKLQTLAQGDIRRGDSVAFGVN